MNIAETLKLAFASIMAHKLRSFLTLLGMIIGMTAFMVVLSLLQGFNGYVDEKIAGIGSNSFTVQRFNPFEDFKDTDTIAAAQRRNKELSFDELDFIKERAFLIDKIGARAGNTTRSIRVGSESLEDVSITGVEPIIGEIENVDVAYGRYFTEAENNNSMRVAYIGADIASKLFPAGNALGGEISMSGIPYRIIGIAAVKGTVFGIPQDNFVQIPIKTFAANFGGLRWNRAPVFVVTARDGVKMADAVEEVRMLMRIKRKLPPGEKDNFGIVTPDAISGLRESLFGTISVVILFVPAIALVVGAIVIMNIMLVAVTERTKEIGIRKSIGAKQTDILRQFLFESGMLAAIGGIIGLILALIIGQIITAMVFPTRIPWWAAVIAIGVSAGVGILAGLFPAWKAARLDPIEALRAD
ncbi:ABC transporter permease [Leptolyngbya sp. 7M]|uniref:ABC transporter permease n=1 Tax=Leptolyngbya sp. 7M TaxID=2812896 RepID=UPI001B8BD05D|nr:ABC transporter permease [Leptolyngbya sp. 7M]QYO63218.1 ABC transporter permease [Leptolyngbya sp. 7M]